MDPSNPYVILHNTSPEITYSGSCEVSTSDSNNTYAGSQHVCVPPSAVDIKFYGKGLELFGELDTSLSFISKLDRSTYTPLPTEHNETASGTKGVPLFDLGALSNPHELHLEPTAGRLFIDYVVYTPVGKTKLDGKVLVYDDTNASLNFTGDWTARTDWAKQPGVKALPFNDTMMVTTRSGSSFSLGFVGSTVAVYGAFNSSAGLLSATFSVDGSSPSPLTLFNSTASSSSSEWTLHRPLFEHSFAEGNSATEHVLNVTVVDASESQPFLLDYVLTTANQHTALKERQFKKTGNEAKRTGVKIVLIILGIAGLLLAWFVWRRWREKRKKVKGLAELTKG